MTETATTDKPKPVQVDFAPRFSGVSLLQCPVGTKPSDIVRVIREYDGKDYGDYRIALVTEPGEKATHVFALAYKDVKDKPKRAANTSQATIDLLLKQADEREKASQAFMLSVIEKMSALVPAKSK